VFPQCSLLVRQRLSFRELLAVGRRQAARADSASSSYRASTSPTSRSLAGSLQPPTRRCARRGASGEQGSLVGPVFWRSRPATEERSRSEYLTSCGAATLAWPVRSAAARTGMVGTSGSHSSTSPAAPRSTEEWRRSLSPVGTAASSGSNPRTCSPIRAPLGRARRPA
jgi:hypothetical protein